MKNVNARKGAAPRVALNLDNLKRTVEFYRAHYREFPLFQARLPLETCKRLLPIVTRVAERFGLTKMQARSVVIAAALEHGLGSKTLLEG